MTAGSNTKINYYAFGMAIQGRKYTSSSSYRYGFNGKESDPETVGTGEGTQDYGFRIYNPSLGKFLSVDPLSKSYPWYTPYQFAGNKPIVAIDLDGLEEYIIHNIYNKKTGDLMSVSVASFQDVNCQLRDNELHKDGNDVTKKKVMVTYAYDDKTPKQDPTFQDALTTTQQSIYDDITATTSEVGPKPKKSKFAFDGYKGKEFYDGTFSLSTRLFAPTPTFGGKKVVSGAKFYIGGIGALLGMGAFPDAGKISDDKQIRSMSKAIKNAGGITEVNITLTGRPGAGFTDDELKEYGKQLNTAAGNIQKEYEKYLGSGIKVNVNTVVDPNNTKPSETTIKLK